MVNRSVAYKTDVGGQREINEDSILVDEDNGIFLLADGLGGHQAGEVASELCVNTIHAYLKEKLGKVPEKAVQDLLLEAVSQAHDAVKKTAISNPNLLGMGTTIVIMVVRDHEAYICHVGDSRAYLVRAGIKQITRDHSYTGHFENDVLLKDGSFQKRSPVLSQAIGTGVDIKPEINHIRLLKGDVILICSDGLTDLLSNKEIEEITLRHENEINEAAGLLVNEANNRGGRDNISVILVKA